MDETAPPEPLRWARFLPALAVFPALLLLASLQTGSAAGESRLLALAATAVLLSIVALAPGRSGIPLLAPLLIVAAGWALPGGPARGATFMLLLAVGLAHSAWLGWRHRPPDALDQLLPLALGLQFLFRSDHLLAPGWEDLPALVLLPVLGALAVGVLARGGPRRALLAAGLVVIAGHGWTPTGVALLITLASARALADGKLPKSLRAGAALALAGGLVWAGAGGLAPLGLCALVAMTGGSLPARLAVVGAALAALVVSGQAIAWTALSEELPWLLILLPSLASTRRDRLFSVLTAVAIGLAAMLLLDHDRALALPLALGALELPAGGAGARLQCSWTALLAFASAAAAAFPWLREEPTRTALGLVGLDGGWPSAILVLILVTVLALLAARAGPRVERALPWGMLTALLLGALIVLPAPGLRPLEQPLVLDLAHPRQALTLDSPAELSTLVVDSYLSYSHRQPNGSPVAILRLEGVDGSEREWVMRTGAETGEWAARRADLQRFPGADSPPAWLSWVADDGPYFGQRYRAELTLDRPLLVSRLELERPPALREKLSLAIVYLELRR